MQEVPSSPEQAVIVGDFEGFRPEELFEWFTQPEKIVLWWPEEATVDLRVGGRYEFLWPQSEWNLSGTYTAVEPGHHLGFTWEWAHEPARHQVLTVDLWLLSIAEGTRLAIYHGTFEGDEKDQEARQGVIEGWIHFGMRLAGACEEATGRV